MPDDEESEECWEAYRYFESQRVRTCYAAAAAAAAVCLSRARFILKLVVLLQQEAEDACAIEWEKSDSLTKPQCERLEQFENFVRQMVGEGHIVNFVTMLQSLSHADQRRLAKDLEASGRQLLVKASRVAAVPLERHQGTCIKAICFRLQSCTRG